MTRRTCVRVSFRFTTTQQQDHAYLNGRTYRTILSRLHFTDQSPSNQE